MKRVVIAFLALVFIWATVGSGLFPAAEAASTLQITQPDDWEYISKSDPPTLKWNSVTGAAGYRVTVKNDNTGKYYAQNEWTTSKSYSLENLFEDELGSNEYPLLKIWVGAVGSKSDIPADAFTADIIWVVVSEYPEVSRGGATDIATDSVTLHMEISRDYGSSITDSGFYLGTSSTISKMKKYSFKQYGNYSASAKGEKSMRISGLEADTKYYYRAYAKNDVGEEYTSSASFYTQEEEKPATPLKIIQQPTGVTVAKGETAKVTIKATGDDVEYQWYYKDVDDSKFTKGSKGSSYSVTMKAAYNGRQVYCIVSDEHGAELKSNTVTLLMETTPLKIIQQPTSVTVAKGETAKVTIKATGDNIEYQWYYKDVDDSKFTKGSTGSSYSMTMSAARDGRQVYCVVSDEYGQTQQSNTVTLRMKAPAALSVSADKWSPSYSGDSKTFTVSSSISYSVKNVPSWLTYKVNKDKLTLTARENYGAEKRTGTLTITNGDNSATITVTQKAGYAAPTLKVKTDKSEYKTGQKIKITATFKNARRLYIRIYNKKTGDTLKTVFDDNVTCKTSNVSETCSFVLPADMATGSYIIEATVSNSDMKNDEWCRRKVAKAEINVTKKTTVTPAPTIRPKPLKITQQPTSVTVADGEKATVTITASGEGLSYVWYYKGPKDSKFTKTSSKTNSYSITMNSARNGRQVYCIVTDKYGAELKSNTVTMSMKVSAATLTVSASKWSPSYSGASKTFTVSSSNAYSVKNVPSWLTYKVNKDKLTLTARENYAAEKRTATVTITNGDKSATITVTQKAGYAAPTLKIATNEDEYTVGQTIKVTATFKNARRLFIRIYNKATNGALSTICDTNVSGSSSSKSEKYTFKLPSNTAVGTYIVEATASNSNVKNDEWCRRKVVRTEITIKKKTTNSSTPLKIITHPKKKTVMSGESITVTIEASGDDVSYQWYYRDKRNANKEFSKGSKKQTWSFTMNKARAGREVYCIVTDKHGNTIKSKSATFNMKASDDLLLDAYDWSVIKEGSSKEFTVIGSSEYTVKINDGTSKDNTHWLTFEQKYEKITLKARENFDKKERTGKVTISNGIKTKTIVVKQAAGYPAPTVKLSTDKDTYTAGDTIQITATMTNARRLFIRIYNPVTKKWTKVHDSEVSKSSVKASYKLPADAGTYEIEATVSNSNVRDDQWGQKAKAEPKKISVKRESVSSTALANRNKIIARAEKWMTTFWRADGVAKYNKSSMKYLGKNVVVHGAPYVGGSSASKNNYATAKDIENGKTKWRFSLENFRKFCLSDGGTKLYTTTQSQAQNLKVPPVMKIAGDYTYSNRGIRYGAANGLECVGFALDCLKTVNNELSISSTISGQLSHFKQWTVKNGNYSFAVRGDAVRHSGHVILVVDNYPKYNSDGSLNLKQSYMIVYEQAATTSCLCDYCKDGVTTTLGTAKSKYTYSTLKNDGYEYVDRLKVCE